MPKDTHKTEARLERIIYDGIRKLGGLCEKVAPTRWGIPDRLVLLPGGRIYLVELKADKGSVRPAQSVWHRKAERLGAQVIVLQGEAQLHSWLRHCASVLEADRLHRERTNPCRNTSPYA